MPDEKTPPRGALVPVARTPIEEAHRRARRGIDELAAGAGRLVAVNEDQRDRILELELRVRELEAEVRGLRESLEPVATGTDRYENPRDGAGLYPGADVDAP